MKAAARRRMTLAVLGLIASPAWAEPEASEATPDSKVSGDRAAQVLSTGSPNSRATAGFSASNLQFSQEGDETNVSVAFSLDLASYDPPKTLEDYFNYKQTKVTLVASTPIEKGSKDANLFAGDSLVSGSKLRLSLVGFSTRVGDGTGAGPEMSVAYTNCANSALDRWAAKQSDPARASNETATLRSSLNGKFAWRDSQVNFNGIMEKLAEGSPAEKAVAAACTPGQGDLNDAYDLVSAYGVNKVAFGRRFLPEHSKLTFWGVDASMGRDDHKFLDRTAFKLETKPRTTWEVGAFYGWINSDLTFSLRGRAVYGQTYEDRDEAEICRTVSIPAGTECIKGPDGLPQRNRTGLVSVEARKLVTVKEGTQIAFAPQITLRSKDWNVGVEFPVYLTPDKDGKLSGGIKAVYNSKGDEFAVGLFVGVPFSIFFDK